MGVKYIAAGFMHDACKLLNDFLSQESLDFKTFSAQWKKHNFFYIFMGRSDIKEFSEFVNEMYQLTMNHVMELSIECQIGSMYLLYALYRNQNAIAPIKIRVTQNQFKILKDVQCFAEMNKIHSLWYVMEYLCMNCIEFVANAAFYGPCCTNTRVDYMKPNEICLLSTLKKDMTAFHESSVLEDLKTLHCQYLKQKEGIHPQNRKSMDISKEYDDFAACLANLVCIKKNRSKANFVSDEIGNRRLKIKNASFERKALFRQLNPYEDSQGTTSTYAKSPVKQIKQRKKRLPIHKRRVGRPRKIAINEEEEESDVFNCDSPEKMQSIHSQEKKRCRRTAVSYLNDYKGPVLETNKQETKYTSEDEISDISEESSGEVRF